MSAESAVDEWETAEVTIKIPEVVSSQSYFLCFESFSPSQLFLNRS
jgi:hypothetical protein